jgi:hypothetical protein
VEADCEVPEAEIRCCVDDGRTLAVGSVLAGSRETKLGGRGDFINGIVRY